jgi:aryl-alcohol dehydrogenase-like predicted oxidoreductase
MHYVRLGRSSLKVSRIGLGAMGLGDPGWRSWVLAEDEARPVIARAVEAGINFFDTCDFYSLGASERVLGKVLGEVATREEVVIATKVGNPMGAGANGRGFSRKHIIEACEASLRRLGTDYIDLYQTHIWDGETDIEEMIAAFDHLVRSGKVLYVGATDMPAWQMAKCVYTARLTGLHAFVAMQHHYNLVWREDEREMIPLCRAEGIGLLPYSPLARGFLPAAPDLFDRDTERARTDDYARLWYGREEDAQVAHAVAAVAERRGVRPSDVALAWVLARCPEAAPIIGATTVEHVDSAVAALDVTLDGQELAELEAPYRWRASGGHS